MLDIPVIFAGLVMTLFIGIANGLRYPLVLETLTQSQNSSIGELRDLVKNELTAEYMREDVYLAKWLYKTNFNVNEALQALREHILWRQQEKIDTILEENWEDMHSKFPYTSHTKDKSGRPLLYFELGQWDIVKFFTEENSPDDRLARYFVKLLEESETHVRQQRQEGLHLTQFNILVDMGGYSLEKHACFQCINFYRSIAQVLAAHFPRCTEQNVFVNVPYLFKMAYSFLSDRNKNSITMYGQDKEKWEPIILELLDRDQVPGNLLDVHVLPQQDNLDGILQWNKEL